MYDGVAQCARPRRIPDRPDPSADAREFPRRPGTAPRERPRFPRLRNVIPTDNRRLVILTEGYFTIHDAKTALGVIRYGHDEILAILDSTMAGRNLREVMPPFDVPFVATLDEALEAPVRPDGLLIGIAPTGGRLPAEWRATILQAIRAGLDVHSGLHQFLGDDPEYAAAAAAAGTRLIDYRRPPDRMETSVGRRHLPGKRVILTVGTDCAIGKMSVALELVAAARRDGASAVMVPTGQTGMMIEGWGVAVDRVISDFTNGTVEWLVEQGEARGDWVIVEGQGSIDHPAYSAVTMGLIHGATPHAMVLVHKPGLVEHDFTHLPEASFPIASLPPFIELHERIAGLVAPSKVVAVALNTSLYPSDDEARAVIESIKAETGLPADDPVRFGADRLWPAVRDAVDALPWV
jgi:D-glutamate N-acetyltransferase